MPIFSYVICNLFICRCTSQFMSNSKIYSSHMVGVQVAYLKICVRAFINSDEVHSNASVMSSGDYL